MESILQKLGGTEICPATEVVRKDQDVRGGKEVVNREQWTQSDVLEYFFDCNQLVKLYCVSY